MNLVQKVEQAIAEAKTPTDKAWAALAAEQAHNRIDGSPAPSSADNALREALERLYHDIETMPLLNKGGALVRWQADARGRILAALTQPGSSESGSWLPIETALIDAVKRELGKTELLLADPDTLKRLQAERIVRAVLAVLPSTPSSKER